MKTQSMLLAALASTPAVLAHTTFTDFYVNGVPQGDGVAMRMNPDASTSGSPISSLDSDDMACNVGGTKGVSRVQSVPDGALLSFEFRSWADDPSKPPLDYRHYGPCAMYLKKVSSAVDDTAVGDGWFKIFAHGYDGSTKQWCTDVLINNKGLFNINLPKGLEGGDYLARPEILALHQADQGIPQMYTGCAQIHLESSGNLGPESTVSIPGYVKYGQPSTDFNIYNTDLTTYTLPGPDIAKLVAKSSVSAASLTQTDGLKPEGCIVENANWCGKEVPSYSDETGCWAADKDCWAQQATCYSEVGPVGGAGCKIWEAKCQGIQDSCNSKNFNGPPNKGKVLTPEKKSVDVGVILATVGGGYADAPSTPKTSAVVKPSESKTQTPVNATPAAEDKSEYQEQAPAKSTPASTPPKASSPAPKPTVNGSYNAQPVQQKEAEKPAGMSTITVPVAAPSPKPTPGGNCVPGGKCVTVTEIETVVQTVYVTIAADSYKRGVEAFKARRRHAHHM